MSRIYRFTALALLGMLSLLVAFPAAAQDSTEFTASRFTIDGQNVTVNQLDVGPEGHIRVMTTGTKIAEDVKFELTGEFPMFFEIAVYQVKNGKLGALIAKAQSASGESAPSNDPLMGEAGSADFYQVLTSDLPANAWIGVRFFVGENANATVNTAAANTRSCPSTRCSAVGKKNQGDEITVVGKTADGTWLQLSDGNWIHSSLVDIDNINNITVINNVTVPSGGGGGNGGGGGGGTPYTGVPYVVELGLGGAATWGNNSFAICQWYRPGTDTSAANHAGAFLARNAINYPEDISGACWVLPGATEQQANTLLAADPVAQQFGTDAP